MNADVWRLIAEVVVYVIGGSIITGIVIALIAYRRIKPEGD